MKKLSLFLFLLGVICKAEELPGTYVQFKYEVMNRPVKKLKIPCSGYFTRIIKEPIFKPMLILLATACTNHTMIRHNSKHQRHDVATMDKRTATVYLTGVTTSIVVYYYIEKNRKKKKPGSH